MKSIIKLWMPILAVTLLLGCAAGKADANYPEGFSIRFVWGVTANNIFDTAKGEIQKDLVTAGTATAEFEPTEELLSQVYEKIQELDITSIDRPMTADELKARNSELGVAVIPLTTYKITITIDGVNYRIVGDETAKYFQEEEDAVRFMEFVEFLKQLVRELPEYQALPEAVGAYE